MMANQTRWWQQVVVWWSTSVSVLKVEPSRNAEGSDVGYESVVGVKVDPEGLGLSSGKNGTVLN